ncbi:MAG: PAS domain S-box protein [Hyphomicrobiales bacterium]
MKAPNGENEPLSPRAAPSDPPSKRLTAFAPLSQWFESLYRSQFILLFIHDATGAILDANPAFCDLLGYSREEVAGLSLDRLLGQELLESYRRFVEDCRTSEASPQIFEMVLKKRDAGELWLEAECYPAPENDTSGLVLMAGRDVTTRKRDDQQVKLLRRSEEAARVLLNAATDAALLIDARGIVLSANTEAAARLGKAPEELVGRSLSEFLPPEAEEFRKRKRMEVIDTGKPVIFEVQQDQASYSVSMIPIRDEKGRVVKLAIYSKDITEEKHSEEERRKLTAQLQQAQKMEAIGTLAGGIAHDFNNLLMAIQGNVSLALFEIEPSHPQHRIFANIEKLVQSGADLTSKLLGYARRGKYESRPLVLNDLVRETSETFGRMRKDITIERDLAEDVKSIIADKGQIEQVLLNLFVNAADAMPTGGTLALKTRNVTDRSIPFKGYTIKAGNYVLLTVSDTGVGMDKDVITRIFDPFFTTKKRGRGTGLGLASAYGIVKSHNGYIDVNSEKDKGSVFYVYLPATDQKSFTAVESSRKPQGGVGTILLIDDEEAVLDVTARMIERLGYTVLKASSGSEAIECFKQDPDRVSLVVLDMIMPNMSGGEVFDELRRINPRVKVLLASGYSMQGQAREIMNRGCFGFIQKPFTMEDLALKLSSSLATK